MEMHKYDSLVHNSCNSNDSGGDSMYRLFLMLWMFLAFSYPGAVEASGFAFDISLSRLEDGTLQGVLTQNHRVVWRVLFFGDGAKAVAGISNENTTVVVPDIVNGLFLLKVYNQ
ncbi:MAG: hypothetical protein H6Q75_1103 [Firmicutes bacterium]|nr:hypothetical protein [Bacillota bacterium]